MTYLPIVQRELLVASRRRGTYWSRFAAALTGVVLTGWVVLAVKQSDAIIGSALFVVASTVVFLYATIAGTLSTCDCLSGEKREGTLGLLFLTDLKGHDVVLGKLAATSVNVLYGMLAVMPMLAIPFILGGVTQAEMLRVVLVSINLLFFSLSLGLFASAVCRQDHRSLGLSVGLGLLLLAAGPSAAQFNSLPYPSVASLLSPATGCFLAFDAFHPRNNRSEFWLNTAVTQIYAWAFFGLACGKVPRSWQEGPIRKSAPWRRTKTPNRADKQRAALLAINPFLWRVARSGRQQMQVWLFLGVLVLLWWFWCARLISANPWSPGLDLFLLVAAGLALKALLAVEASRTFSQDRWGGGLELLLTTPLGEGNIVRGQVLALWRQFALPTMAVLLANVMFLMVEICWLSDGNNTKELISLHLVLAGFLAADMIALSWVGMWLGLINRKPNRAALLALACILALPMVVFFFFAIVSSGFDASFGTSVFLWIVMGLAADLSFGLAASVILREQFRSFVAKGQAVKTPEAAPPKTNPVLQEAR